MYVSSASMSVRGRTTRWFLNQLESHTQSADPDSIWCVTAGLSSNSDVFLPSSKLALCRIYER